MSEHIHADEWTAYFSNKTPMDAIPELYARVHAHIGRCEECRALWQQTLRARDALSEMSAPALQDSSDAYLAVASREESEAPAAEQGCIEFTLVFSGGKAGLLPEAPSATGNCAMYVFQMEENRFVEDCDPGLYVEADGDHLTVSLPGFKSTLTDELGTIIAPQSVKDGIIRYTATEDGIYILTAEEQQ